MQSKGSFFYEEQYTSDYAFTQRNTVKEKVLGELFIHIILADNVCNTEAP